MQVNGAIYKLVYHAPKNQNNEDEDEEEKKGTSQQGCECLVQ